MRQALVALVFSIAAATAAAAQVPPVWFGTWHVDVERSTYSGAPGYRRATYTIEPAREGLKVVYEAVLPRGGVTHLEWTGKLDGRDYAVEGSDQDLTYAYRAAGDGTYELTAKIDGHVAAMATVSFSADGKTMTTTTNARSADGKPITTKTIYRRD